MPIKNTRNIRCNILSNREVHASFISFTLKRIWGQKSGCQDCCRSMANYNPSLAHDWSIRVASPIFKTTRVVKNIWSIINTTYALYARILRITYLVVLKTPSSLVSCFILAILYWIVYMNTSFFAGIISPLTMFHASLTPTIITSTWY